MLCSHYSAGSQIPSDAPCTLVVLPGRTSASQTPCSLTSANNMRLSESVPRGRVSELHRMPGVPPQRQVSCVPHPDSSKGPTSYWLCSECKNSSKIINMSVFLRGQPLEPQAIHFESPSSDPQAWRLWPYLILRWWLRLKTDWRKPTAGCAMILQQLLRGALPRLAPNPWGCILGLSPAVERAWGQGAPEELPSPCSLHCSRPGSGPDIERVWPQVSSKGTDVT